MFVFISIGKRLIFFPFQSKIWNVRFLLSKENISQACNFSRSSLKWLTWFIWSFLLFQFTYEAEKFLYHVSRFFRKMLEDCNIYLKVIDMIWWGGRKRKETEGWLVREKLSLRTECKTSAILLVLARHCSSFKIRFEGENGILNFL